MRREEQEPVDHYLMRRERMTSTSMLTTTEAEFGEVACNRCDESWPNPTDDPDIETTRHQWQCPNCGHWNDRDDA